jgi:hypothetical protein
MIRVADFESGHIAPLLLPGFLTSLRIVSLGIDVERTQVQSIAQICTVKGPCCNNGENSVCTTLLLKTENNAGSEI